MLARFSESASFAGRRIAERTAGLCGLAGGCLFFAGDMLMYGHFGAAADFPRGMLATLREASLARLFFGGLVGPFAACLCSVGFWHVYRKLTPGWMRVAILSLSASSMATLGAVHVLWVAKGVLKRDCLDPSVSCAALTDQLNDYWNTAYYLGALPAYLGCALLAFAVVAKRSVYPRWTVAFNPALSLLVSPLLTYVPAPLGAPLVGGDANLFIAVFFLISVATTWSVDAGGVSS
jgi:hypothetical protein